MEGRGLCPFLLPVIPLHTGLSGPCKDSVQVQPLPQINKMRYTLLRASGGHRARAAPAAPRAPCTLQAADLVGGCVSPGPLLAVPAQSSDPFPPSSVDI